MKRIGRWLKAHPKTTGLLASLAAAAGAYYGIPEPMQATILSALATLVGL